MANVKTRSGIVRNAVGTPMTSKPAQLINATTGALVGATSPTDVNGRYTFAGLDETVRYSVSVAFGGGSSQVHVNSPISPDLDDAYINISLRSAPGAVVAFGGPVSLGGPLAVTGNISASGTVSGTTGGSFGEVVAGNATLSGNLSVDGGSTLNGTVLLGAASAPAPALAFVGDPDTGIGNPVANQFQIMTGNVEVALFAPTFIEFQQPLLVQDNIATMGILTCTPPGGGGSASGVDTSGNLYTQAGGLNVVGNALLGGTLKVTSNIGFYNTTPVAKPTVTGSRGSNAALTSLLTALANLGLVTNSSS